MAFPIFLSCDSSMCNTNIRYVSGSKKSAVSGRFWSSHRPVLVVIRWLFWTHPRNIYQCYTIHGTRCPVLGHKSIFNNGRRAMQGRIDFEAKVRRKAASNSPMYMCLCMCQWILTVVLSRTYRRDVPSATFVSMCGKWNSRWVTWNVNSTAILIVTLSLIVPTIYQN